MVVVVIVVLAINTIISFAQIVISYWNFVGKKPILPQEQKEETQKTFLTEKQLRDAQIKQLREWLLGEDE